MGQRQSGPGRDTASLQRRHHSLEVVIIAARILRLVRSRRRLVRVPGMLWAASVRQAVAGVTHDKWRRGRDWLLPAAFAAAWAWRCRFAVGAAAERQAVAGVTHDKW